MDLRICNYVTASKLLEREPQAWHALVVLDSGGQATDFVATHTVSHLFLRFDDIHESREGVRCVTAPQIVQAFQFAQGKEKLVVSCRAGQGRSAALAYLLCCRAGGVHEAIRLLDPTRHRPNQLVVALGSACLGVPDVLGQFEAWRKQNAHIKLSDYYHEMEKEMNQLEADGATNKICSA